jgi:hypothetical protein
LGKNQYQHRKIPDKKDGQPKDGQFYAMHVFIDVSNGRIVLHYDDRREYRKGIPAKAICLEKEARL